MSNKLIFKLFYFFTKKPEPFKKTNINNNYDNYNNNNDNNEKSSSNDVNQNIKAITKQINSKLNHSKQEALVFEKLTNDNNLNLNANKTSKTQKVHGILFLKIYLFRKAYSLFVKKKFHS